MSDTKEPPKKRYTYHKYGPFCYMKGPNNWSIKIGQWLNFGQVFGLDEDLKSQNGFCIYLTYPSIVFKRGKIGTAK